LIWIRKIRTISLCANEKQTHRVYSDSKIPFCFEITERILQKTQL
jgi:hypothetical protein